MKMLNLAEKGDRLNVLCIGAHSDDIEIGAGGTILGWIAAGYQLNVEWWVLSAVGDRRGEAEASAADFLDGAFHSRVVCGDFKDSYFPDQGERLKGWIEDHKPAVEPDVVLTHRRDDAHQDHREVCKLTWNAFRDQMILEYEIPKWDGDLGRPNLYVPLGDGIIERKIELLEKHFGSQRSKDWFDGDTFRGLARLRGMECRAPSRFAEGFVMRKAVLG